jgi:hypothetical protein
VLSRSHDPMRKMRMPVVCFYLLQSFVQHERRGMWR